MEVPSGPTPFVVLEGLEDAPHPFFTPLVSVWASPWPAFGSEFADDHGKSLRRLLHLGDPLLDGITLEGIGVIGVDHPVSSWVGQLLALEKAGHVVRPVQAARDHHVPGAGFTDGIEESLHPDRLIGLLRVAAICPLADLAAFEPDVPTDVMRLVIQVEEHGGVVLVGAGEIPPEGGAILIGHHVLSDLLAPLAGVRPVQIQQDVTSVPGAVVDDLVERAR